MFHFPIIHPVQIIIQNFGTNAYHAFILKKGCVLQIGSQTGNSNSFDFDTQEWRKIKGRGWVERITYARTFARSNKFTLWKTNSKFKIRFKISKKYLVISLSENWFYNTVNFVLVKSTKTFVKREITIISFVFVLRMHHLLNFEFVFFFKFVSRLFALCFMHTEICSKTPDIVNKNVKSIQN